MTQNEREILGIMDDQGWIWRLVKATLQEGENSYVRLPSDVPIRASWNRFKDTPRIILHWESTQRSGGAVVEEILSVDPYFDVGEKIIVLTTNPTHEDVVYFSELGIRNTIALRNRDKELTKASKELREFVLEGKSRNVRSGVWRKFHLAIDALPNPAPPESTDPLRAKLEELVIKTNETGTAKAIEARASLLAKSGQSDEAIAMWEEAISVNPNFHRSYNQLILHYRRIGDTQRAFVLMQKMQELNKSNISRMVAMGEVQVELGDDEKAEHFFESALSRDALCGGALNGLAELRFRQGDIEESRRLLAKSSAAERVASNLNRWGISMVKAGSYGEALQHYTKAQYVLPQQEKGPLLFYNIGLCYSRWGKEKMAQEFLKLALIKDPKYEKARRLLTSLQSAGSDQV